MPKVTFAANYDWKVPGKRQWVAFKAGWSGTVTTQQAADAKEAKVLK